MTAVARQTFAIGPAALLLLAIPVLLFGEQLAQRVRWLGRSNIPAPIIGAFLIVTVVGAFLIDFSNAILIAIALNFLK